jgi:hypothetical protein
MHEDRPVDLPGAAAVLWRPDFTLSPGNGAVRRDAIFRREQG